MLLGHFYLYESLYNNKGLHGRWDIVRRMTPREVSSAWCPEVVRKAFRSINEGDKIETHSPLAKDSEYKRWWIGACTTSHFLPNVLNDTTMRRLFHSIKPKHFREKTQRVCESVKR